MVRIRRMLTEIVLVQAGQFGQSSVTSASHGSSPWATGGVGVRRCVQARPLNTSRSRAFQYSGSSEVTRITSLPSRGQVIGP